MTSDDKELLVGLVDLNREARQDALDRGIPVEFLIAASVIDLIQASHLDHDDKLVVAYVEDWKQERANWIEQTNLLLKKL